jgi:DNA-binding beta-propeller fold protein YncE
MNRAEFLLAAAATPLVLHAPTPNLALVTADTESRLAVVDLDRGIVRSHIPTRPDPRSIERVGESAVVAHTVLGELTIVDTRSLQIRHVLAGLGEPRYTAGTADGRHAFVSDSGHIDVVTVDLLRGAIVGRLKLTQWPRHLSLSRDGRTLWVGLGTAADELAVVDVTDPRRPLLRGHVRPPFLLHDVVIAPDGRWAWVTGGDSAQVAVYDQHTARLLHVIPSDPGPQHVSFTAGRAFVTSGDAGTLRLYDASSLRHLATAELPVGSYNVQFAGRSVLSPSLNAGTLCVVDSRGALTLRMHVAASSHDACLARP